MFKKLTQHLFRETKSSTYYTDTLIEQSSDSLTTNHRELESQSNGNGINSADGWIKSANELMIQGKTEQAIESFLEAIKLDYQLTKPHQQLAQIYKQQGNLKLSIHHYQQAIKLNNNTSIEDVEVGNQEQETGNSEGLNQKLSGSSKTLVEAVQVYIQQAEGYYKSKRWDKTIAACRKALSIAPQTVEAYKILGNALQKQGKTLEAMGYYAQALEIDPSLAEVHANLGSLYAKEQQWSEAISYYQKAIAIKPNFVGAYRNLAKVWQSMGETQSALSCLFQVLSLEPDKASAQEHLDLGNKLLEYCQYQEGITCYRRAIRLQPDWPPVYQKLADALVTQGEWQEATRYYRKTLQLQKLRTEEKNEDIVSPLKHDGNKLITQQSSPGQLVKAEKKGALVLQASISDSKSNGVNKKIFHAIKRYHKLASLKPDSSNIQVNLGYLYSQIQQWNRAIAHYQQAITLDSKCVKAYINLGKVLAHLGKQEQGIQCWYRAFSISPTSVSASQHLQLGDWLLEGNKLQPAVICYRRAISLQKDVVEAYHRLGEVLVSKGKIDKAITVYSHCLQYNPQDTGSYSRLGQALAQNKQWEKAIAIYRRGIKLDPRSVVSHFGLAEALVQQQQWEAAISHYQTTITLKPGLWRAHYGLGRVYLQLSQWEKAVRAFSQAIELKDSFSWSYNGLGEAWLQLEKWQEAARVFQRVIELNPEFAWSYYNWGIALGNLQDWDGAVHAYRRAMDIQADLPNIELKLVEALRESITLKSQEALKYYHQVIAKDPENIDIYYQALEIQPDDPQLYGQLGDALVRHNQIDQAIDCYQKALVYQPQHPEIIAKLAALQKSDQSNHSLVLAAWDKQFQEQPECAKTYLELGKSLIAQEKLDEAIIWLKIAIDLSPCYAEAHFQLGNALKLNNDLNRAINCYHQALEIEPDNCWYFNGLGDALVARYDLDEAILAYSRAIAIKADYEGFYSNLEEAKQLQSRWLRVCNYTKQILAQEQQVMGIQGTQNPLRILMIAPYPLYPANTGGAIRMFEQLKYFGKHNHVTLVSFIFSEEDYQSEEKLSQYCDFAVMVNLGAPIAPRKVNQPKQIYQWETWNMGKILQELSKISFDVVLFDFIFSTPYQSLFADKLTVLNEHNIESELLKQCAEITEGRDNLEATAEKVEAVKAFLNAKQESKLLAAYENKTWPNFPLRVVCSDDDKLAMDSRCRVGKTIVVRNGIDTRKIVPVANSQARKILFMGTMAYYPNIDAVLYFVESIMPYLREENVPIKLCIAGRDPAPEVQQLATNNPDVEVIANPENMSEVARDCSLTVVPLRLGSGTRIKILHAMAMGLPVISTSKGCEGIEAINGVHFLIRDQPEDFAQAILQVSSDADLRNKLRQNGRQLVEEKYDWQNIFAEFEQEIRATQPKRS